jgi:hypothetical protein
MDSPKQNEQPELLLPKPTSKKKYIVIGGIITFVILLAAGFIAFIFQQESRSYEDYINTFYREAQIYEGALPNYRFYDIYEINYPEIYEVLDGKYKQSILLTSPNYREREGIFIMHDGQEATDMIQGHSIMIREIRRSLSAEDAIAYFWNYKDKRPINSITLGGKKARLQITLSDNIPIQYQAATILDSGISYVITAAWVGEKERQQAIDAFYTIITSFQFIE